MVRNGPFYKAWRVYCTSLWMIDKVKAGIIGLGRLGKSYAQLIQKNVKHVDLLAACSLSQEELAFAKTKLNVQYAYTDYHQIVNNHDLDAIFLLSPPQQHAMQVIDAVNAGKHVFTTTPLGTNVENCDAVIKAVKSRPSQVVMIGFEHRYDAAYIRAKEIIQKGQIGEPILVHSGTFDKEKNDSYYQQYGASAGGIFMELNIKNIDIVRWLTGKEFSSVTSAGGAYKYDIFKKLNDADNVMSLIELEGGGVANISASRLSQDGFNTKTFVLGTEGSLEILDSSPAEAIRIYDTDGIRTEGPQSYFERYELALLAQANDFVNCIQHSQKPKVKLEDGLEATRAAVAMTKSFLMKERIEIDR